MTLSYAIIGTGAIGGYYGALLAQAGCEVHFLLRSDYQTVCDRGLDIKSIDGDFALPQVNAYKNASDLPPVDVAIVALKTTSNHLLPSLLPSLKPNGAILSLQNGLGIEAEIVQQLSAERTDLKPTVLGGLCFIYSNKVGSGRIQHLGEGKVLLGAHNEQAQPSPATHLMESIAADFTHAKISVNITEDLPMARWRKLVWNVPYNGLSVVLNSRTGEMMDNSGVRSLIVTLMQEVIAIANAWGDSVSPGSDRALSPDIITQMLTQTEQMPFYRTSMKVDYDEGRSLEVDAILGNPLRTAQALNVAVPAMNMLYQQLAFINAKILETRTTL